MNRYALACAAVLLGGCTSRPPFIPNADPALNHNVTEFAADAAHRHYETDAPKGGKVLGRAEVDYGIHRINIVNTSNSDWNNVELWLNQKYVIYLPKVLANSAQAEVISFQYIFDDHGHYFPLDSSKTPVNSVDIMLDGKMYAVPTQLAD